MINDNLSKIGRKNCDRPGMDIVIISTTNSKQQKFWREKLEKSRGIVTKSSTQIYSVVEDWKGGAGNGLGSLYAFKKGIEQAAEKGIDLFKELDRGASIAIYHTAGKGTRLAPLPASEQNNKSAVKLPSWFEKGGKTHLLTMLEAVIQQTALFAKSRRGRLSVFWGDQIFIPSKSCDYSPTHAVDILCKLDSTPGRERWKQENWSSYGLLALDDRKNGVQVEKISYSTFEKLLKEGILSTVGGIGQSLGAFSLSKEMVEALMKEFSPELEKREGKLDSDPHFWMPLCLDLPTYLELLDHKGKQTSFFTNLHKRAERVKRSLKDPEKILTAIDIGKESYWWDFGTVHAYYHNNLKVLEKSDEGNALRQFYGIAPSMINENGSLIIDSNVDHSKIHNSIIMGASCHKLDADRSLLIDVTANGIATSDSVLYNVVEEKPYKLPKNGVRSDTFTEEKQIKIKSTLDLDGKTFWEEVFEENSCSFSDLYALNETTDFLQSEKKKQEAKEKILSPIKVK